MALVSVLAVKLASMSIANETHPIVLSVEPPLDAAGASLFRDAVRREIAAGHEECLRWFCLHPATPLDVLLEIYESGLCLDELGHRRGPRVLLEKLADEANCPEAIVTRSIQLYTEPSENAESFEQFIQRNSDNLWMLDSLARQVGSSAAKEAMLEAVIAVHAESERLKRLLKTNRSARQAAHIDDPLECERLYATGEPAIWLALAGNPSSPRRLLERLANARDVCLARQIRNRARDLLHST